MLVVYQSWFESIDTLTHTIQLEESISLFSGSYLVTTPRNMGIQKRKGNIEITIGTTGFENLTSCINFEMHVSSLKMLLLQVQRTEKIRRN